MEYNPEDVINFLVSLSDRALKHICSGLLVHPKYSSNKHTNRVRMIINTDRDLDYAEKRILALHVIHFEPLEV